MVEVDLERSCASAIGFWAALAAAGLTLVFAALALAFFYAPEWTNIQDYAAKFHVSQMASFVPALLLVPVMIVLMACFCAYASGGGRTLALAALAFTCIYGAIIATNYYLQLFVVRLNLQAGQLDGLSILAMPNLRSVFFAMETIGYLFLSLATLVLAPVLSGSRLADWLRRLFITNGLIGIYGGVIALFDRPLWVFAGLAVWTVAFPVAMVLSALLFKQWGIKDLERGKQSAGARTR